MFPRDKPIDHCRRGHLPSHRAGVVGEVSGIVETQFGYHLIKVTDKKPARTIPYKEVQLRLEQHLKKEKGKTEIQGYIENLKKSAKIKRFI